MTGYNLLDLRGVSFYIPYGIRFTFYDKPHFRIETLCSFSVYKAVGFNQSRAPNGAVVVLQLHLTLQESVYLILCFQNESKNSINYGLLHP
jgi:hypothetical protein